MPFELDDHTPFFTVGQVAELLGVAPAWLRRLDAEALVQPQRTDGGQRRYTQAEVSRAERVAELTGEGLTLGGVARIMALESEVAALRARIAELEQRGR